MAGGGGKTSNRGMGETIALMVGVAIVGLQVFLVFKKWWVVWEKWMALNPVTPLALCFGILMLPVSFYIWLRSTGKRLGEEAEDIARGTRR